MQPSDGKIPCYNCWGMDSGCDAPGCSLCYTLGYGWCVIPLEYQKKPVIIDGKLYTPPNFACFACKDKKTVKKKMWIEELVDERYSDHGAHNMPTNDVDCPWCNVNKCT